MPLLTLFPWPQLAVFIVCVRLKLFKEGGEEVKYQGQRDLDSLSAFVTEHTGVAPPSTEGGKEEEPQQAEEEEEEEGGEMEVKVDDSGLIHLTDSNFEHFISSLSGLHFVKFYAPWSVSALMHVSHQLTPFLHVQVWPL